ncbi:MAG: twin-arginine translocase subunit TatB [Rhodospirillales bacterium]|nr:twin-arginine translocase subunit TatB [Rhodospirillales bacterium]
MFDIGGWEFMLIVILGIVIIGPKELPGALRNITIWIRKARGLAREFQSGIDDIVQEAEFDKIRQDVMDGADPTGSISGIKDEMQQALDPDSEIEQSFSMEDSNDWFSDHDEIEDDLDEDENSIALPTDVPAKDDKSDA